VGLVESRVVSWGLAFGGRVFTGHVLSEGENVIQGWSVQALGEGWEL